MTRTHGSTFAGNPLAMAVAEVILDEVSAPGFLTTSTGVELSSMPH